MAHIASYETLYLSQIDRIMMAFKYIIPHYHTFVNSIATLHALPLYLISKKCYQDMKNYVSFVLGNVNFNKLTSDF